MKKALIIGLSGLLFLFGTVSIAGASPITFTDITTFTEDGVDPGEDYVDHGWGEEYKLDGFGDYVVWTHQYDFIPAVQTVLSGNLFIYLIDDDDPWWQPLEFAFGWAEDGTWDFGEVDTGMYSYDVSASFLADGKFTVALVSLGGDFYIDKSELEITYEPVPEPATMLLFGAGLVGLAGIHRKKRA